MVEQGATEEVLRRPRSEFAASISGVNMVRGAPSAPTAWPARMAQ